MSQTDYRLAYGFMQRTADIYVRQLRQYTPAVEYLRGRGFTDSIVQSFGLGYAPRRDIVRRTLCTDPGASHKIKLAYDTSLLSRTPDGTYRDFMQDRLIFPIRWPDKKGKFRVVAFGGRTLCDDNAKYINSRRSFLYNKSAIVYGLDQAFKHMLEMDSVVLVEGYTDCVAAHQAGVCNVVAASGTAFTDEGAHILAMYARTAKVLMDGDEAGRKGGDAATTALRKAGMVADLVSLPDGLDPADFIASHGAKAFTKAVT